jgi:F-type H+-transporting ATPase subunit gamma
VSQLTPLKRKIKSIQTTQKITHAVRLISMSFYSKLEKQNVFLQDYKNSICDVFTQLVVSFPEWKNPVLFPEDILDSSPLFVIISSSKGLCGSFNSNLFRYFERAFFVEKHQKATFITIGQKATNFIKEKNAENILQSYEELTLSNFDSIAAKLVSLINDTQGNYSSVSFFSNYLKNFFVQRPQKSTLTPVSLGKVKNNDNMFDGDLIWEQSPKEILDYLAFEYLRSSILNILFQSMISENAARFLAMDSSTTNAEKILEKLTLQFNKTRQALITKEVAELSANL